MRRAVVTWIVGLVSVFGVARVVALPETCGPINESRRIDAANAAIGWMVRNQGDDGRFLYRYDLVDDIESDDYNWIRHAGAMLSLAQALNSGFDIGDSFERAFDAASSRLLTSPDGSMTALTDGDRVTTGGSALLLLALLEHGSAEGATRDHIITGLANFIDASIDDSAYDDGSLEVREVADTGFRFEPGSVSPFTTGEVAYALARYSSVFPRSGLQSRVHGVLSYLIRHKAVVEGYVPDMADHWAAYATAEMTRWPGGAGFTSEEVDWARKQMGLASVMVRYESQRTNHGFDRWLRGRTSVGSAIGTHGEMLSGWMVVADAVPGLADQTGGIADRLRCNMSILADRQIGREESRVYARPDRAEGAWTWFGVTQVDDQQHSLSALVRGGEVLASGIIERQEALPSSWLLVVLAMFVAFNPWRVARAARRAPRLVVRGRLRILAAYLVAVIAGSTVLGWLDTSVPTAVVAAGVALVASSLVNLPRRRVDPSATLAALRPEALVLAVACGAGGRGWAVVVAVVVAIMVASRGARRVAEPALVWWSRTSTLVAITIGVMLIVSGVYAV